MGKESLAIGLQPLHGGVELEEGKSGVCGGPLERADGPGGTDSVEVEVMPGAGFFLGPGESGIPPPPGTPKNRGLKKL